MRSFVSLLLVALLAACASLPPVPESGPSEALRPADSGALAELGNRFQTARGAEASGFALLSRNDDALDARLALIDHATSSIDLQYFIWEDDASGRLLLDRIAGAAERGVRVRLLVDDFVLGARSRALAVMDSHANLEIRVFNPNPSRDSRLGSIFRFLASFQELNRRMHNKIFIVDGRVAIAGGRNLGDPYFGLSEKYNFRDLDVLAVGAVVEEISESFDRYWNDEISYPAHGWGSGEETRGWPEFRSQLRELLEGDRQVLSSYPMERSDWSEWLRNLETDLKVGEGHFLQDDPVEIEGESYRLADMLAYLSRPAQRELIISTPYLIPVGQMLHNIGRLGPREVRVRLLTGSLGSNNHTAAHSHYKKYRRRLLATGAELYEFHHEPAPEIREFADVPPVTSSFVSLHAKTMVADRERCFIGSLNFDPRALVINTENGLLIESPELAAELADELEALMAPESSWRLSIGEDDRLLWESAAGVVHRQPARKGRQRLADFFLRHLPIESQL